MIFLSQQSKLTNTPALRYRRNEGGEKIRKRWLGLSTCRVIVSKLCQGAGEVMGVGRVPISTYTHQMECSGWVLKMLPPQSDVFLSSGRPPRDPRSKPCKLILFSRLLGLNKSAQTHHGPGNSHPSTHHITEAHTSKLSLARKSHSLLHSATINIVNLLPTKATIPIHTQYWTFRFANFLKTAVG